MRERSRDWLERLDSWQRFTLMSFNPGRERLLQYRRLAEREGHSLDVDPEVEDSGRELVEAVSETGSGPVERVVRGMTLYQGLDSRPFDGSSEAALPFVPGQVLVAKGVEFVAAVDEYAERFAFRPGVFHVMIEYYTGATAWLAELSAAGDRSQYEWWEGLLPDGHRAIVLDVTVRSTPNGPLIWVTAVEERLLDGGSTFDAGPAAAARQQRPAIDDANRPEAEADAGPVDARPEDGPGDPRTPERGSARAAFLLAALPVAVLVVLGPLVGWVPVGVGIAVLAAAAVGGWWWSTLRPRFSRERAHRDAVRRVADLRAAVEALMLDGRTWLRLADALGGMARVPPSARLPAHAKALREVWDEVEVVLDGVADPGALPAPPPWVTDALPDLGRRAWMALSVSDRVNLMLIVAGAEAPVAGRLTVLLDDWRAPADLSAIRGWFLWPALDPYREQIDGLVAAPAAGADRAAYLDTWAELVQLLGRVGRIPGHDPVWERIGSRLDGLSRIDETLDQLRAVLVDDLAGFVLPNGGVDLARLALAGTWIDLMHDSGGSVGAEFWERALRALRRVPGQHLQSHRDPGRHDAAELLVIQLIRASLLPLDDGDWGPVDAMLDGFPGHATRERRLQAHVRAAAARWSGWHIVLLANAAHHRAVAGEDVADAVRSAVVAALGERWSRGAVGYGPLLPRVAADTANLRTSTTARSEGPLLRLLDELDQVVEVLDERLEEVGHRVDMWMRAPGSEPVDVDGWTGDLAFVGRLLTAVAAYRDAIVDVVGPADGEAVSRLVDGIDDHVLGRRVAADGLLGLAMLYRIAPGRVWPDGAFVGDLVTPADLEGLGDLDGRRATARMLLDRPSSRPADVDHAQPPTSGLAAVESARWWRDTEPTERTAMRRFRSQWRDDLLRYQRVGSVNGERNEEFDQGSEQLDRALTWPADGPSQVVYRGLHINGEPVLVVYVTPRVAWLEAAGFPADEGVLLSGHRAVIEHSEAADLDPMFTEGAVLESRHIEFVTYDRERAGLFSRGEPPPAVGGVVPMAGAAAGQVSGTGVRVVRAVEESLLPARE